MEGPLILLAAYLLLTPGVVFFMALHLYRRINGLKQRVEELESARPQPVPVKPQPPATPQPEPDPFAPPSAPDSPVPPAKPTPPADRPPAPQAVPRPEPIREPEPITVPVPEPEPEPMIHWSVRLRDFLRQIGMWPPESVAGGNREALLMQWWLPRVGGLLALLSALFFGVYINQSTSPWIRCLEMAGASLGITALGRYMEGRFRTFGGVILVTGLVMLYLTSVAAYVLPAVRVIENPLIGALAQAAVLAGISVVGFLRRSEGIVLLAFHLGYVLGVFMAWEGLREGALIAAGLLFLSGALLSRVAVFRRLVWVIIPGSYLVGLAFPALALWRTVEIPLGVPFQIYLNAVTAGAVILYLLNNYNEKWGPKVRVSMGTSLAILTLVLFFRSFYPDALDWAAFVLGCTLLAGAVAARILRGWGFLAQLLFVKATFLIAVWAVLYFAGDLRWMVLALQTAVVAISARRARAVAVECAAWAVAVASLHYFLPVLETNPVAGTFLWWMMALYPAVILIALAHVLPAFRMEPFHFREADRRVLYAALPVVALVLWFNLFRVTQAGNLDAPAPFIGVMYGTAALALLPGIARWIPAMASALAFVTASVLFCTQPFSLLLLLLLTTPASVVLYFLWRNENADAPWIENAIYPLTITPAVLWVYQAIGGFAGTAVVAFLLAWVVTLKGILPMVRHLGAWAFLPPVVLMVSQGVRDDSFPWMLSAVPVALGWLFLPRISERVADGLGWARRKGIWETVGCVILWYFILMFDAAGGHWLTWQLVLAASASVLLVATRVWPIPGYFIGAVLLTGSLFVRQCLSALGEAGAYAPYASEILLSGAVLHATILLGFFLKPAPWKEGHSGAVSLPATVSAAAAIAFFLNAVVTFQYNALGLSDWYTPIIALNAFVLILLGLFRADAVFRKLGLAALAFPLIRLFVVDVQDALYRIIAFAAAAVVLTVLGYLYHRLSSLTRD